jgi:predicted metal-dependent hydrolase
MDEKRVIYIGDKEYLVRIFYERRGYVRASITSRGVNIRVPKMLGKYKREEEIIKMLNWARKKLLEEPIRLIRKKRYSNFDYLKLNCRIYQLNIKRRNSIKNFSKIRGNIIDFKIAQHHSESKTQKYISKQLQKMLAKEHLLDLKRHVNRINNLHFREEVRKISYKYTISRWGICNSHKKEINFSTRLLLAPMEVLEYVIVHELAHLIEANHSKDFWNIVKRVDPEYKRKIKWLKDNSRGLEI